MLSVSTVSGDYSPVREKRVHHMDILLIGCVTMETLLLSLSL